VHLLSCDVKCTVTDSPFSTQANCSKCPPSAWISFLTRVTRELVTLRSAAEVLMVLATLRKFLNCCELDPFVYGIFDSASALVLNPELLILTPGTTCIFISP